jgi:predicted ATPase
VGTIWTPDQRLRVFISSTLHELGPERAAARRAVDRLRLTPVLFEMGARPHPPRELYLAYLEQSDVFVGLYWQSYGWVGPGERISGIEDEFRASAGLPRLVYVKDPAPSREGALVALLREIGAAGVSYRHFTTADQLESLLADDLAVLVSERFAAGRSRASTRAPRNSGLRGERNPFVGRTALLEQLSRLLVEPEVRLVTLTGAGGVGKTRLAHRAARQLVGRFPAGVHVIELASTSTREAVTSAIAAGPGIGDVAGMSTIEQVAEALSGAPALLVLDNFEHLIAMSEIVAELVTLSTELTVLVTSREILRLRGEHVVEVPPLEVPPPELSGELLRGFEGVALFLDRVAAVRSGAEPDDDDVRAAGEIVRRLDGLPLAIELAAARCRLFRPSELLEQFEPLLTILDGGPRDAPERQRTLRNTIRWSYDLLPAERRELFERLGVLVGGFGLDSASAVAGSPGDQLDGLADLLDRSLLRTAGSVGGVLRFQMLETIRQFARERLEALGIVDGVEGAHARHFLALAEQLEPEYQRGGERLVVERSTADHANLVAAADWFAAHGRPGSAVRIAEVLWRAWWVRGRFREGIVRVSPLLQDPALSDHDRARALFITGHLAFGLSDFESSRPLVAEAVRLFDRVDDHRGVAQALVPLAVIEATTGDRSAEGDLQRAMRLARDVGDSWTLAFAELAYGSLLTSSARHAEAVPLLEGSIDHNRELGTEVLLAYSLDYLARARIGLRQLPAARALLLEALDRGASMGSGEVVARTLTDVAALAAEVSATEPAARFLGASDTIRGSIGAPVYRPDQTRVAELRGRLRAALGSGRADEVMAAGRALGFEEATDVARTWLSGAALDLGP